MYKILIMLNEKCGYNSDFGGRQHCNMLLR